MDGFYFIIILCDFSTVTPVVDGILDNHSFLVDTVVIIVHPSNFPRSRFGDKMRRKAMIAFIEKRL
jgi:hypothetical protein